MRTRLETALRDRYTLEHELGRGGMATVWLGRDLKHDRPVAMKVLRPELWVAGGPDRFLREIRATANLQHPHILPLFDSGEADDLVFYVMPYVTDDGGYWSEIWRLRLPGTVPERFAPVPDGCDTDVDLSADRQRAVCTSVRTESDVFLATGLE